LKELITQADEFLYLLDSRNPQGQRDSATEEEIAASGKKITYVLSKADLVEPNIAMAWQNALAKEGLNVFTVDNEDPHSLGHSLKEHFGKSEVTLALIGFHNCGKKTVLNDLKEALSDSKNIKVLDNTGVIKATADEITQVLAFQACVIDLKEPIKAIEIIIANAAKEKFLMHYKIANFKNPTQLLTNVCQSKGMMKKGGDVDLESTARVVIEDWNNGAFGYNVAPPEQGKKKKKKFKGMAIEQN
jgi:ribosome biogenesis GTPase A